MSYLYLYFYFVLRFMCEYLLHLGPVGSIFTKWDISVIIPFRSHTSVSQAHRSIKVQLGTAKACEWRHSLQIDRELKSHFGLPDLLLRALEEESWPWDGLHSASPLSPLSPYSVSFSVYSHFLFGGGTSPNITSHLGEISISIAHQR